MLKIKELGLVLLVSAAVNSQAFAKSTANQNKEIVVQFYKTAFVEHKARLAAERFIDPKTYIQHNPNVPNGRQAFIDYFEPYFAAHPELPATDIKRVVAEGDLVVLHSHAKKAESDLGVAVVDIFRVENNKIVEHWDVIQAVPATTVSGNGMF